MQRASAQQAHLAHRVLTLVQHLHLLIPALRSSAIRPEEEALRAALEEIDEEMRKPGGGGGRMHGKLNELWALVGAVHAAKEKSRKGPGSTEAGVEWAVIDEEGLAQITQVSPLLPLRVLCRWLMGFYARYYPSSRQDSSI
jgi:nuclear pore complex protein Nup54